DQVAREILRHLSQHKLTVVWMFDESASMKDDQRAIKAKFDRVATELKANIEPGKVQAAALNHAIVGFGSDLHFDLEKPTANIDRQSLFGFEYAHLRYVDPVTKDVYWPTIRRGPETADVEILQWDGLHSRWDEQPSGFAPYELARLAKDTGGIYFLLPSEEGMRITGREKAYSIETLKEYVPDYESRLAYAERRARSEFRRTLYDIVQETRKYPFRHIYS